MTNQPTDGTAEMRTATADSVAASADSRSATSDSRKATGHAETSKKRNDRSAVSLILAAMALLVAGGFGLWNQHQQVGIQSCLRSYIATTAPLAQARDAAQQRLWDDLADFQHPPDGGLAALKADFFADLAVERAASVKLQTYRAANLPGDACP